MPAAVTTSVAGFIRPQVPVIAEAIDAWAADMLRQRCKPRSIDRFIKKIRECASWCEWTLITSPNMADASRWLTHKIETSAWSPPTHDQACSILRCFGGFLRKHYPKDVPTNPLEHLESSGEQGGEGARALRTEEARAMIAEALRRMRSDKRSRGNPPAFLAFLCYSGLRHDEAASCRWKDLDLDGEIPAIYSDPSWAKNKRRMRVVLGTEIIAVLKWHRTLVRSSPGDRVFPVAPNRHTWQKIREAAGVKDEDARGRAATYHSCRKWLATELDRAGASPGVVSRLLRHAGSLAEARYIDPDASAEIAAVSKLPSLWPENEKGFLVFSLDGTRGIAEDVGVTSVQPSQLRETSVPGRNAGAPSSQTVSGNYCQGPSSFMAGGRDPDNPRLAPSPAGERGLIEHGSAHCRAQSGHVGESEGVFELEPLDQSAVAGRGGSLSTSTSGASDVQTDGRADVPALWPRVSGAAGSGDAGGRQVLLPGVLGEGRRGDVAGHVGATVHARLNSGGSCASTWAGEHAGAAGSDDPARHMLGVRQAPVQDGRSSRGVSGSGRVAVPVVSHEAAQPEEVGVEPPIAGRADGWGADRGGNEPVSSPARGVPFQNVRAQEGSPHSERPLTPGKDRENCATASASRESVAPTQNKSDPDIVVTPRRDGENSADPVATCDAGDDAACGKRVGEPWSHDTGTAPRAGVSREVWQNAVGQVCGAEVGRKGQAPLREPNPPSETGATPVLLTSEATRGGSSHPGVGPHVAGPAPFTASMSDAASHPDRPGGAARAFSPSPVGGVCKRAADHASSPGPAPCASGVGPDSNHNATVAMCARIERGAVAALSQEPVVRNAFMTAAAALLALAVGASAIQPVARGYANGKDCAMGSGCLTKATIAECVLCCGTWCNYGGFLTDCQNACLGGAPGTSDNVVHQVAFLSESIRANQLTGDDLASAVSVIELASKSSDARVAAFAQAIGNETPFVRVVQHEVPGLGS